MKKPAPSRASSRLATAALLAATSFSVLAIAGPARADGGGMPCAEHHIKDPVAHVAKIAPILGLSAGQKATATKMARELAAKVEPLVRQADSQHEEIRALLESKSPDAAQIGQKVIAMHASHEQVEALHQQAKARFESMLSADQRARFAKMHADHAAKSGSHGHGDAH